MVNAVISSYRTITTGQNKELEILLLLLAWQQRQGKMVSTNKQKILSTIQTATEEKQIRLYQSATTTPRVLHKGKDVEKGNLCKRY